VDENALSNEIIGAAIEVHKTLGPGLLESIYEDALEIELGRCGLTLARQVGVTANYKGHPLPTVLRLDLCVNDLVIVEIKSVDRLLPIHQAQLLSYLRLANKKLGLLINFNSALLKNSIRRIVNNL
jgi:GxxExxY protein